MAVLEGGREGSGNLSAWQAQLSAGGGLPWMALTWIPFLSQIGTA